MQEKDITYIPYKIWSDFNQIFDEIQNCRVMNRKSDIWFTDIWKLMLTMRQWTVLEWNYLWDATGISDYIFFKWEDWTTSEYLWYNKKVYKLISSTWTAIHTFTSWWDIKFNIVKLPWWTKTWEFTSPTDSTQKETIYRDTTDWTPANNSWKFLYLSWPTWMNKWKWSYVSRYDSDNSLYELWYTWLPDIIPAWVKYYLFDKTIDYLQVSTWSDNEIYYDWTSIETIYTWQMTEELRNVKILGSSEYVTNLFSKYNWAYWYPKWNIIYASLWLDTVFPNPFYYSIWKDVVELPNSIKNGDIIELFNFKDRLVVWWDNFVYLMNSNKQIQTISESYWMVRNSIIDVDKDVYFLTNNKQLISLSENINWIVFPTNIWEYISNYLKDFNYSVCAGFDSENFYLYWEKYDPEWSYSAWWIMLVYNVKYKFWNIYIWLRCSKIVSQWWVLYVASNIKWQIQKFSETAITDSDWSTTNKIIQKLVWKEIDWWNVFFQKELAETYIHLENYDQDIYFDVYMMITNVNGKKVTKEISLSAFETNDIWTDNLSMWETNLWYWILWWDWGNFSEISRARLIKIMYEPTSAQTYKWIMTGKDWSPFYLNEIKFWIWPWWTNYFFEQNTI